MIQLDFCQWCFLPSVGTRGSTQDADSSVILWSFRPYKPACFLSPCMESDILQNLVLLELNLLQNYHWLDMKHPAVIRSNQISAAWVLTLKIKTKPQRRVYTPHIWIFQSKRLIVQGGHDNNMSRSIPVLIHNWEGEVYIQKLLHFIYLRRRSVIHIQKLLHFRYLTAKFDTRQDSQKSIPSNPFEFCGLQLELWWLK